MKGANYVATPTEKSLREERRFEARTAMIEEGKPLVWERLPSGEFAWLRPEPKPPMRIPCSDWNCKREHEWLPVGITRADYHVDERKP